MNNIKIISSIGKRAAVLCAFLLFCLPQCFAQVQRGKASYYHHRFHGNYPFGTPLKVTNVKNGKWTVVKVVDRGPHVRGRIIDLSYAAAKDIDMVRAGTATVEVEKIDSLTYIRLTAEPPQIPDSVLCRDSLPQ